MRIEIEFLLLGVFPPYEEYERSVFDVFWCCGLKKRMINNFNIDKLLTDKFIIDTMNELQPSSRKLGDTLSKVGGKQVWVTLDPLNEKILNEGHIYNQKPHKIKMKDGMCYSNTWYLHKRYPDSTLHTGYVLVKDIWTRHSWIITRGGNIMETTYPLKDVVKYYGIQLESTEFLKLMLRLNLIHLPFNY